MLDPDSTKSGSDSSRITKPGMIAMAIVKNKETGNPLREVASVGCCRVAIAEFTETGEQIANTTRVITKRYWAMLSGAEAAEIHIPWL